MGAYVCGFYHVNPEVMYAGVFTSSVAQQLDILNNTTTLFLRIKMRIGPIAVPLPTGAHGEAHSLQLKQLPHNSLPERKGPEDADELVCHVREKENVQHHGRIARRLPSIADAVPPSEPSRMWPAVCREATG